MRVDMAVVYMGSDHSLKTALQQSLGKFHTKPVGLLRRHFAGRKGMDDVIALSWSVFLIPATLGFLHVSKGGIKLTVDRGLKNLAVF